MTPPSRIQITAPDQPEIIALDAGDTAASLADQLERAGLPLNTRCGKRGLCNGCLVELTGGRIIDQRGQTISAEDGPQIIQACQCTPNGQAAAITLPRRSLLAAEPHVTTDFALKVPHARNPIVQRMTLPGETLQSADTLRQAIDERLLSDWPVRFSDGIEQAMATMASVEQVYVLVERRTDHWRITTLSDTPLPPPLAIAVDIGTTTVAVLLLELESDRRLAEASDFNQQMHLGDNVLTRINHCIQDEANVEKLQQAIVDMTLRPLVTSVLAKAAVDADRVRAVVAAGNTTMLHLLAGVNPAPLGVSPFEPVFVDHHVVDARDIGLTAIDCAVHLLPCAAGYIGADLVGGAITSGLRYEPGPSLLVDIGTNGEIILKHGDRLLGCATAAGPAFEGAGLKCGMRAGNGAISRIEITGPPFEITTRKIGDRQPVGLCGSAYIDLLSEARRCKLINTAGRFDGNFPEAPLTKTDYGYHLSIGHDEHGKLLEVTESDIASLLQAKAAIAAGILTLLRCADLQPSDVRTLHLAGGFGMNLHLPSALGSGLLPGFTLDQIDLVGNTSLAGAALGCWDGSAINEMQQIRNEMEVIELNLDPQFEMTFIDQLQLP